MVGDNSKNYDDGLCCSKPATCVQPGPCLHEQLYRKTQGGMTENQTVGMTAAYNDCTKGVPVPVECDKSCYVGDAQDCCGTEGPSCPAAPGALDYAFEAASRVLVAETNALENEIIAARELGQREGRDEIRREHEILSQMNRNQERTIQQTWDRIADLERTVALQNGQIETMVLSAMQKPQPTYIMDATLHEANAELQRRIDNQRATIIKQREDLLQRNITVANQADSIAALGNAVDEQAKSIADLKERNGWQSDRLTECVKSIDEKHQKVRELQKLTDLQEALLGYRVYI